MSLFGLNQKFGFLIRGLGRGGDKPDQFNCTIDADPLSFDVLAQTGK